ncbi:hypothetical protein T281_11955 [Rhodomicrobium udaipurense JA643]|nr:hypothetical protein T281_11955 [Rhodomicrobium udaipurense JA643]
MMTIPDALLMISVRSPMHGSLRPSDDLSTGDARQLQCVENADDVLQCGALIACDDDDEFLVRLFEGSQAIRKVGDVDWLPIQEDLAVAVYADHRALAFRDLIWRSRTRRLYFKSERGKDVYAYENKENKKKHHHINHRNDLDACVLTSFFWPISHAHCR